MSLVYYLEIELIKFTRSKYPYIIIAAIGIVSAAVFWDFHINAWDNFQIHLIKFPGSNFQSYFLHRLSTRLNFIIYFFMLCVATACIEIDHRSNFIGYKMISIPINIVLYIVGKMAIGVLFTLLFSLCLYLFMPYFISTSFAVYGIKGSPSILSDVMTVFARQAFFLFPLSLLFTLIVLQFKLNFFGGMFTCIIAYFISHTNTFIYPINLFQSCDLSISNSISISDFILTLLIVFVLLILGKYKLKNYD